MTSWKVRPVRSDEFDAWTRLYRGYAAFYETPTSDEHQRQIWSWIHDHRSIECLVAVPVDGDGAEVGAPQGLAHLREWVRPLRGVTAGYLDDLFVDPDHRGSGAVDALFDEINRLAVERDWAVIRWTTADDNYRARTVYDRLADRTTWITYDMPSMLPRERTGSMTGAPHVELGMYPFVSVAPAWDTIWAAVHERVPWTPASLTRSGDVHARWYDDDCIVTQVCGWPFAARHHDDMHVVGAFSLDLPDAEPGGYYHSVLLSPHDRPLSELVGSHAHAVANSADSLSGWHSLRAATVGAGRAWPGRVTFTSTHHDSVRALAKGEADLASIDAWSLAFITAEAPELVRDLHRVGAGPRIPTPALTARKSIGDRMVDELRDAFDDALRSPDTATARAALHIDGFARLDLDDYLATLPLGVMP